MVKVLCVCVRSVGGEFKAHHCVQKVATKAKHTIAEQDIQVLPEKRREGENPFKLTRKGL